VTERVNRTLSNNSIFVRFGAGVEPETGRYWLADETQAERAAMDRLESVILSLLRAQKGWRWQDLDRQTCLRLNGLLTPERRSVAAVLGSYATLDEESGTYRLREEDNENARQRDLEEVQGLLQKIGRSLGFETQPGERLKWLAADGSAAYTFVIQETAFFQPVLEQDEDAPVTLVLPGGRANLVSYKARRDERVVHLLEQGHRVIKFRHVRRLASETTLTPDTLKQRLAIDPVAQNDPQLPLL
jgi:hypothetical protein